MKVVPTYIHQLPDVAQQSVYRQLRGYGFTEEEVEDIMDGKISDVVGDPDTPIRIAEKYLQPIKCTKAVRTRTTNRVITSAVQIPLEYKKYYKVATQRDLDDFGFVDADFAGEIETALEDYGYEYVGIAVAKSKYLDKFADYGIDIPYIVKTDQGDIKLVNIIDDRLFDVMGDIDHILDRYYY